MRKDVTAIGVMSVEFPSFALSFAFQASCQEWVALSADMEGWNLSEQAGSFFGVNLRTQPARDLRKGVNP